MIQSDEPLETISAGNPLPKWLPEDRRQSYLAYLQQYCHNVNLLRFFLDISQRRQVRLRSVDLDEDGFTGLVILQMDGTRCIIESGNSRFHGWDEHTQIYFEDGWIRAWSSPLFARPSYNQVELYEGGQSACYQYPIPKVRSVWHYREEAAHFVASLKEGRPFESSGEDAFLDVWILEEIYKRYLRTLC